MVQTLFLCICGVIFAIQSVAPAAAEDIAPATQPAAEPLRPILSDEARAETARKLIDQFIAHTQASVTFTDSARQAVREAWDRHRADEEPRGFLTAALAMISEPFKIALTALDNGKYQEADEALKPLMSLADPYLSLHATALLARSLVEQERYEEAEKLLAPLAAHEADLMRHSFLEAEVDFLLGYCQLSNLHYEDALRSFEQFEQQHPQAPERFRLSARQMLQELRLRQPDRLGDVSDLMTFAGRRLTLGDAGVEVQGGQRKAIDLLDRLIKEAEDRENQNQQGGGKGSAGGSGRQAGGMPASPAPDSMLPGGQGKKGELHGRETAKPGEMWGQMAPEERQRILQSLRQAFPGRYRQLVEQYYRQLAKEQ